MSRLIGNGKRLWQQYYRKFLFASVILLVGSIIGYFYEESQSLIPIKNPGYNWFYYFSHNGKQAGIIVLLGVVSYGILSLLLIFMNGLVIGIGIETMLQHHRSDLIWTHFLPHALFELTAIMWAWVLSFMIGRVIIQWVKERRPPITLLKHEVLFSVISIIFLLLIAAVIEGR